MKILRMSLLALTLVMSVIARAEDGTEFTLFGDGLPLPWPFPWAKECPVEWEGLQGRYMLSDSSQQEELDLDVKVEQNAAYKVVRIARFTRWGQKISSGFSFVNPDTRSISMEMIPNSLTDPMILANLQLHYVSKDHRCAGENLVPILTLQKRGSPASSQTQYRLMKLTRRN